MGSGFLRRRAVLAAVLAGGGLLAVGAAPSPAATLSESNGTATYTAGNGLVTDIAVDPGPAGGVAIKRNAGDTDPITASSGCTDLKAGSTELYVCDTATSVSVSTGDRDDSVDAGTLGLPVSARGGDGSDTLLGGTAADSLSGGAAADTISGGDGDDTVAGDAGFDTLSGDAGDDTLDGGADTDSVTGGAGNDVENGGAGDDVLGPVPGAGGDDPGDDTLDGGDGGDTLSGGSGNDVENGDAGTDVLGSFFFATQPDSGADRFNGGSGDDILSNSNTTESNLPAGQAPLPSDAGDVYAGGDGYDSILVVETNEDYATSPATPTPRAAVVTLDGAPNDGGAGERDNVLSDVEAVSTETSTVAVDGPGANDTLIGAAGPNDLAGGGGDDTIDGGAGNDVERGDTGNDTLDARDGYADFVSCGDGVDTANVDTLDTVSSDCETVNRVNVGNANAGPQAPRTPEDRPPSVSLSAPKRGAHLPTNRATRIAAGAGDDHGISAVQFLANGRLVCTDASAPYRCSYRPQARDVGRTALVAIAIDTTQQTATARRTVHVKRFSPRRFTEKVSPRRDRRHPWRFTTRGRVYLPTRVSRARGCSSGSVAIQVTAGHHAISTRHAKLTKRCTYRRRVTFHSQGRFRHHRKLKVTARFGGNAVLARSKGTHRYVRVG